MLKIRQIIIRPTSRVICLTFSSLLFWAAAIYGQSQFPAGSYAQASGNYPIPLAILENPGIVGIHQKASWKSIEISEGVYNWSNLDQRINEAVAFGKKVSLNLFAGGVNTPEWVLSNPGVQLFYFIDDNPYHSCFGDTVSIPIFWDSLFLEKKINFIQAVGARYASNHYVVATMVSFANSMSNEWHVPHKIGWIDYNRNGISGDEGDLYVNQVHDWLDAGYTTAKIFQAGKTTIDAWANALPDKYLKLPVAPTHKLLDSTATLQVELITDYAYHNYPDRFLMQVNGLSTRYPVADSSIVQNAEPGSMLYLLKLISEHSPNIGLQMLAAASDTINYRLNHGIPAPPDSILLKAVNRGLSYCPQFLEYWQVDGEDTALGLRPVIQYATESMKSLTSIKRQTDVDIPASIFLFQNYPNPFNPETVISFQLPVFSKATLKIYDVLGQEVRTLVNENKPAGAYSVIWNGNDNSGRQVSSGVYFYSLELDNNFSLTRKLLLLK